jgi:hypothetical protein
MDKIDIILKTLLKYEDCHRIHDHLFRYDQITKCLKLTNVENGKTENYSNIDLASIAIRNLYFNDASGK